MRFKEVYPPRAGGGFVLDEVRNSSQQPRPRVHVQDA